MDEKLFTFDTAFNFIIYSYFYNKNIYKNLDFNNCYFEIYIRHVNDIKKEFKEFDKYDKLSDLLNNINSLMLKKIPQLIDTAELEKMKEQDERIFKLRKEEINNKSPFVLDYLSELNIKYDENACKKINIGNGFYLLFYTNRQKVFASGKDFHPGYFFIYMWHELLHCQFGSLKIDNNLKHSIIELLIDNELFFRLFNYRYPPYRGHSKLYSLKQLMQKQWDNFLMHKDFNQFIIELKNDNKIRTYISLLKNTI